MYYVIKLEIGTTKRVDSQHKRYVSFPPKINTQHKTIFNKTTTTTTTTTTTISICRNK